MKCELRISHDDFWQKINELVQEKKMKGGVYKLHCLNHAETEVVEIPRCLASDEEGILYIGKATSFLNRVIELKKSLLPKYKTHTHVCGLRYSNDAHEEFRSVYPVDRLFVTLYFDKEPEKREAKELFDYCGKFGETPPLNSMEQASLE